MASMCTYMCKGGKVDKVAICKQLDGSRMPIDDTLLIGELINWKHAKVLTDARKMCAVGNPEASHIDEKFTDICLKLYEFCGRIILIQLLHSVMHSDFDAHVGKNQYLCILGCVRFIHQEICWCEVGARHANLLDISKILDVCLTLVGDEFELFQEEKRQSEIQDKNPANAWRKTAGFAKSCKNLQAFKNPADCITSKMKADQAKAKLTQKGTSLENYNYQSAYTMMVGLDASIRLHQNDAMQLHRVCLYGLGAFAAQVKANLLQQKLSIYSQALLRRKNAEAQMSSDCVLLCLSAVRLKLKLTCSGSAFSRKHLLADDKELWLEEYAPALFGECRAIFNVSENQYKRSVSRTGFSYIEFVSNSKSGEMFFFSWDGKYIIKTISEKEVFELLKMLPKYIEHVSKPSLLMRICGLYRVSVSNEHPPRFFLIAISVVDAGEMGLHHQFDLKGSTVGRKAGPEESTQKDLNWINDGFQVCLPAGLKRSVAVTLENDANFLKEQKVLDYSVMIGIHDRESKEAVLQNKGVRLLQGIVKQKSPDRIGLRRRSVSCQDFSQDGSKTRASSTPSIAEFAGRDYLRSKSFNDVPRQQSKAVTAGAAGVTAGIRQVASMDNIVHKIGDADATWLNSISPGLPITSATKLSRISSASSAAESDCHSISRVPSCMSDPYERTMSDLLETSEEASEDLDSSKDGDDDDAWRYRDQADDSLQRLMAWLPPISTRSSDTHKDTHTCTFLSQATTRADAPSNAIEEKLYGDAEHSHEGGGQNSKGHAKEKNDDGLVSKKVNGVVSLVNELNTLSKLSRSGLMQEAEDQDQERDMERLSGNAALSSRPSVHVYSSSRALFETLPGQADRPGSRNSMKAIKLSPPLSRSNQNTDIPQETLKNRLRVYSDVSSNNQGWIGMHGPISAGNVGDHYGRFVYYIGIIDFLIPWDAKKKAEFAFNCLLGRGTRASCAPPEIYARRQIEFVFHRMLGLFDHRSAESYALASVAMPPPKPLKRNDEEDQQTRKKTLPIDNSTEFTNISKDLDVPVLRTRYQALPATTYAAQNEGGVLGGDADGRGGRELDVVGKVPSTLCSHGALVDSPRSHDVSVLERELIELTEKVALTRSQNGKRLQAQTGPMTDRSSAKVSNVPAAALDSSDRFEKLPTGPENERMVHTGGGVERYSDTDGQSSEFEVEEDEQEEGKKNAMRRMLRAPMPTSTRSNIQKTDCGGTHREQARGTQLEKAHADAQHISSQVESRMLALEQAKAGRT